MDLLTVIVLLLILVALSAIAVMIVMRRGKKPTTAELPAKESQAAAVESTGEESDFPGSGLFMQSNPRWRMLVVDDIPEWNDVIGSYAAMLNCDLRYVTNLTAANLELERKPPDLLLLDLHMPRDPWQPSPMLKSRYRYDQKALAFCHHITNDPRYADLKVVIVSVEEQQEEKDAAAAAGAHAYFLKSEFTFDELKSLANRMLTGRMAAAAPSLVGSDLHP